MSVAPPLRARKPMNAATVKSERPMAHASCGGRRLRRYCRATATANAPDTSAVTNGSTAPRLAPADDERSRDDTQDCSTYERDGRRIRSAGRPRERRRDERIARAHCCDGGRDVAPQRECDSGGAAEREHDGGGRDEHRTEVAPRSA